MEFLKKRGVAYVLAAIIIASSTLVSANIKLQKESDRVTALLSTGVKYEGYKHADIITQLTNICGAVENFVNFVPEDIDVSALKEATEDLRLGIRYSKDSAYHLAACYNNVIREFNSVSAQMQSEELTDTQARALEAYSDEIAGAQKTIADSGYNDAVRNFYNDDMGAMAKLFAGLTGVEMPEYFD